MQRFKGFSFCLYSGLLGAGTALVGVVVGLLIKTTPETVAVIVLLAGLLCIALAILLARQTRKRNNQGGFV